MVGADVAGGLAFILVPARRLLSWWLGELAALVPARLRQRFVPATDALVLLLDDGAVLVCVQAGRTVRQLGRIDVLADAHPQQSIETLLRDHQMSGFRAATLRLRSSHALRTSVDLPLAAEQNLTEVIAFELDRHTPFRADQACFSHRMVERDAGGRRLRVELTIVPRPVIDDALALAARLGIAPARIEVADDTSLLAASGNLLPAEKAAPDRRHRDKPAYALAAAAILLACVALYLPIRTAQRADIAIDGEVAAAKQAAASVAVLQKEVDALRKDEGFLVDRKRGRPAVSALLLELTQILPDDTWLVEWQLDGTEIQLQGFAASAASLVKQLEQSREFRDTTFQSPVVQDARTGRERFHISAQIVPVRTGLAQNAADQNAPAGRTPAPAAAETH